MMKNWRIHLSNLKLQTWTRGQILYKCSKSCSSEKREIAAYLLKHGVTFFPYRFQEKYEESHTAVLFDDEGYPYVIHNGKKLFLKKEWTVKKCQEYYVSLLREQDNDSPHKYLNKGRNPVYSDIAADLGAAEGIFGLDIIEDVQKIYLFEADEGWKRPLEKTFAPWKDKAEVIWKYVGDKDTENMIKLDTFFENKQVTYLKADIEGAEADMLSGGGITFTKKLRIALICVYHRQDAEQAVKNYLRKYGFACSVNPGYVLFLYDKENFKPPYLRRCLMTGIKRM